MQEYPKALYRGEEMVTVDDADQEKAARADGYAMYGEQADKGEASDDAAPARRGRPPKAAAQTEADKGEA